MRLSTSTSREIPCPLGSPPRTSTRSRDDEMAPTGVRADAVCGADGGEPGEGGGAPAAAPARADAPGDPGDLVPQGAPRPGGAGAGHAVAALALRDAAALPPGGHGPRGARRLRRQLAARGRPGAAARLAVSPARVVSPPASTASAHLEPLRLPVPPHPEALAAAQRHRLRRGARHPGARGGARRGPASQLARGRGQVRAHRPPRRLHHRLRSPVAHP